LNLDIGDRSMSLSGKTGKYVRSGIFTGLLFFSGILQAQITAPGAAYTDSTQYPDFSIQDPVYVYYRTNGGSIPVMSLQSACPEGESDCRFEWYRFRASTNSFDSIVKMEDSVALSQISGLTTGGYQLTLKKPGYPDTAYRAWVFLHELEADADETSDGKVPESKYTCDYVELNATVKWDTLVYADPLSGTSLRYFLKPTYYWSSINDEETVEYAFSELNPRNYSPPALNTRYIIKATDASGIFRSDTVLYVSIQTRADFSFLVKDAKDEDFRAISSEGESAPLLVRFQNESINGSRFQWRLSDTTFTGQPDPQVITTDTADRPEYTYYIPRTYKVTLISTSPTWGCVDSVNNTVDIIIKASNLAVPNFFTPDIPGGNSRFLIVRDREKGLESYTSIKSFHITIFSRWGVKVYEYDGDINDWEGWDGNIKDSHRPAAGGYYFYVIEARGYDKVKYKGVQTDDSGNKTYYTGFLYLYR